MQFALPNFSRYSFASWFLASLLVGIALSIPLLGSDLAVMLAWEDASNNRAWLQWWASVSSRSLFGGGLGAQDISHLLVGLVVLAYGLSFWNPIGPRQTVLRTWSTYYLACLLCFFVVNRGMKVFFGRVRPSDVMRNEQDYTSMWCIGNYELADALSKGSFASGHTTMAMILLPLAFTALGRGGRAVPLFIIALTWGLMVGWGRVINGSHYPSDILWAIIVCIWICAYVQAHLVSPNRAAGRPPPRFLEDVRLMAFFLAGLLFFFLAATGIKEMVYRFSWWWPGTTLLAGLAAWFSLRKAASRAERCVDIQSCQQEKLANA